MKSGDNVNRLCGFLYLSITCCEDGWATLRPWLEGLTDDEFFWEPIPGCWTLHQGEDGRWVEDYQDPAPDPPPFTTLAWRVIHVAACKMGFYPEHVVVSDAQRVGVKFPPVDLRYSVLQAVVEGDA